MQRGQGRAGRLAARAVFQADQSVRRRLHRNAADELARRRRSWRSDRRIPPGASSRDSRCWARKSPRPSTAASPTSRRETKSPWAFARAASNSSTPARRTPCTRASTSPSRWAPRRSLISSRKAPTCAASCRATSALAAGRSGGRAVQSRPASCVRQLRQPCGMTHVQQPPNNPAQAGMTAKQAKMVGICAIIAVSVLSLVLLFQPFSLALYSVGAGLVVLAGLAFNLVPLCTPGRTFGSLVKGAAGHSRHLRHRHTAWRSAPRFSTPGI